MYGNDIPQNDRFAGYITSGHAAHADTLSLGGELKVSACWASSRSALVPCQYKVKQGVYENWTQYVWNFSSPDFILFLFGCSMMALDAEVMYRIKFVANKRISVRVLFNKPLIPAVWIARF